MEKLELIKKKIFDLKLLQQTLTLWRFQNKKIVFTNGCFDLIHLGHIDYLAHAADFGDILIVGLNSDNSVRRLKGAGRPITDEQSRSIILASLCFIDAVIFFDEETPYELIKKIQPDILVKGGDYKIEDIVGYDIVINNGGEVKTIDFVSGYSTSLIEKKIRSISNL
jgi:D-glycero-beta-D-manno-heptose 1-phosphate adenylyltransferase